MSTASHASDNAGQTPGTKASGKQASGKKHTAGAYDVRTVIAALIGFYGVVLTVVGIVDNSESDRAKTGDVNANLWAGIAMIVVALVFALWLKLRPVVVDPAALERQAGEGTSDGSDLTDH
jgi:predicted benzoate:H+ symporter BenE